MSSHSDATNNAFDLPSRPKNHLGLQGVVSKLAQKMERDELIQTVVAELQRSLAVNRIALYYFYRRWNGQVTFEALSHQYFSIFGMTGADDCFNDEYAELYEAGRYRAIDDLEKEPIHACHKDFLRSILVKSNLVVPVLTDQGLWGLLAAHHCQNIRAWSTEDIAKMQAGAEQLAKSPTILDAAL